MPRDEVVTAPVRAAGTVAFAGIGDEAGAGLAQQIGAMRRLGWGAIELRTIDGTVLAALGERAFAEVAQAIAEHQLAVPCVASQIAGWSRPISGDETADHAELDVLAGRCAALGCGFVRVMSYANDGLDDDEWGARAVVRLRELARRAEQAGLVLLHENCTGWAGRSGERMLALLDAVDSRAFGLLFDTGNGVDHGYDPFELLRPIAGHVRHVHVKDAVGRAGDATYVEPGAGRCRVAESLRLLLGEGFAGTWSIEPHVALRPHEGLTADVVHPRLDGFVACGTALERLVADQVLPAFDGWRMGAGGLVRNGAGAGAIA